MAMSQFSYAAVASYRMRGEQLPVAGGFDAAGHLTQDPAAIEASKRPLPIGYWKGSGLALMLHMVATMLSGGCATFEIPTDSERETKLSQIFIAINAQSSEQSDTSTTCNHKQPCPVNKCDIPVSTRCKREKKILRKAFQ